MILLTDGYTLQHYAGVIKTIIFTGIISTLYVSHVGFH